MNNYQSPLVNVRTSILWHRDPLLGKDLETTTRQQMLLYNGAVNTPYNNRVTLGKAVLYWVSAKG
jgi:hypothetical protein